ncbi:aspartyl-tRNA(Asn)/glutamyl-tRNA(Gln) amidotransferase subunit A [Endobacter medicaginis]|jgi:aspartyl-tRNA(Asn)/glutamyl-tRNA(Gln) amidotransferase subunit A|uniref:Amidase n=1 Tax=Endobacter medicaginis TaxID=1181271 RepID=A0A839V024_9PROT|nr:amidase [Endobacter medicaginis]MBB3173924.1 aspartyl-tRNA(Asn)/glutamyl-tRNA(Gln) amidotransferase subunit A [Endobacter medicaginis]MCX5475955.1 amidase [Endobacter medicaginis]NVN29481.1 amidase [Endobacter medicaginis]
MSSELCFASARALAGSIASGALRATELMEATLRQAERVEPQINALAHRAFDAARRSAEDADGASAAGAPVGPLHGLPITVKDGIAISGLPNTSGSKACRDVIASSDDIVWARLRNAGAILIAKTTTPEFFSKVLTDSAAFGVTTNPWSPMHSPGGSSGGAAAALAVGVGVLAVGSDGGGSLRCPASCTNTVAIKPTLGRIPNSGVPDTFANFASIGPMARRIDDLELLYGVMTGSDRDDAQSLGASPMARRHTNAPVRRIGWLEGTHLDAFDPDLVRLTREATFALAGRNTDIVRLDGDFLDKVFDIYSVISCTGHAARWAGLPEAVRHDVTPAFLDIVRQGLGYSAVDFKCASNDRTSLFRRIQKIFDDVGILAMPALSAPAQRIDAGGAINSRLFAAWARNLYPFNLTGHPALVVPCGFSPDGLPVGLQLVGRWHEEAALFSVGRSIEAAACLTERHPCL